MPDRVFFKVKLPVDDITTALVAYHDFRYDECFVVDASPHCEPCAIFYVNKKLLSIGRCM
jgi:hypothetical protein